MTNSMETLYEVYWTKFQRQFPTTAEILRENPLLMAAFKNAFYEGYKAKLNQGSSH